MMWRQVSALRALAILFAALTVAMPARVQQLPPTQPPPAVDPRRGPRLEYRQGPTECLPEAEFRKEVAIAARSHLDHLDPTSPDVVRVWFERIPGGFRGFVEYTDATGEKDPPDVKTSYNCEILGRWVAGSVSETIPRAPEPTCPPCPEVTCPACPACVTPRPPAPCPAPPKPPPPWRMDLSVGVYTYAAMTAYFSANVGPAVAVGGDVRGEVFGMSAELRFAIPSVAYAREPVPGAIQNRPVEFDLGRVSGLLVPCARYKYFVGCGVAELNAILMQSRVQFLMLASFAFGPRLGFEVPFAERFAAFGFAEVLLAPSPPYIDFILPDPNDPEDPPANSRWNQPVASAFFGAGVSMRFR
jgi:hypothetical protein